MQAYLHLIETVSAVTMLALGAFTFLPDLYVDCLVSTTMPTTGGVVARQACASLSRDPLIEDKTSHVLHCLPLSSLHTCMCWMHNLCNDRYSVMGFTDVLQLTLYHILSEHAASPSVPDHLILDQNFRNGAL